MSSTERKTLLTSDVTCRYEFMGLQALLMPYIQYTSAQRAMMFASHIVQALVVNGSEPPMMCTGWEGIIGKYEFTTSERDQDIIILAVIPKFRIMHKVSETPVNPTYTVIYQGQEDGMIGCFDVSNYTHLQDGFGYMNNMLNQHQLAVGNYVNKDVKFTTSPNHHGEHMYGFGVNCNFAYIGEWGATEDAFIFDKNFVKRYTHTAINSLKLNISENDVPLNLYGDRGDGTYKAHADIGQPIKDGIILGIREKNESTFLTDMNEDALCIPQHTHDTLFKAEDGAVILDVNVYINPDIYYKLKQRENSPYQQFVKYKECQDDFCRAVLAVYDETQRNGNRIRPEFNSLVTRCIGLLSPRDRSKSYRKIKLFDHKTPIDFINVELIYAYQREVHRGFKFTGRYGDKGVVSDLWETENMPIDQSGVRAQGIGTGASIINRMNPGQNHEQFDCALIPLAVARMRATPDHKERWSILIELANDIRPNYALLLEQSNNAQERIELTNEIVATGKIYIPYGFLPNRDYHKILHLAEKWNVCHGPVSWNAVENDGSITNVVTESPCLIGAKYLMLLGKIPASMLAAVSVGYSNQFGTPVKPTQKITKMQSLIGKTPQRLGEDETNNEIMVMGAEPVSRQIAINGGSPEAVKTVVKTIMTSKDPMNIMHYPITSKRARETNVNIKVFNHAMACAGYDLSNDVGIEDTNDAFRFK